MLLLCNSHSPCQRQKQTETPCLRVYHTTSTVWTPLHEPVKSQTCLRSSHPGGLLTHTWLAQPQVLIQQVWVRSQNLSFSHVPREGRYFSYWNKLREAFIYRIILSSFPNLIEGGRGKREGKRGRDKGSRGEEKEREEERGGEADTAVNLLRVCQS